MGITLKDNTSKKVQIMETAIDLFAEKGFDAVGIDEIAAALGMKGPALYYYFKSKDDLLKSTFEFIDEKYYSNFGRASTLKHIPHSVEELVEMSMKRLNFTIHDPAVIRVRKLMVKEQFRNDNFGLMVTMHTFLDLEEMYTVIFTEMIKLNLIKPYDPKLLAFEFSTPISMLIQLVDRDPERESEVMERIMVHMNHFVSVYKAT